MNEQILQTAYKLFTSQGIQPFTMDEIAARLAISKKTLYRFFDSRHHLVQQVCKRVADNYEAAMATVGMIKLEIINTWICGTPPPERIKTLQD